MTPDDITRLAWSSKIISELAGLTCLRVSDKHFDAEVLPREAVMAAVCKIRDATREGEAVIRTLARQGKGGGVPDFRERVSEIEDAIAAGKMDVYQCFTQMRQLIVKPSNSPEAGVTDEMVERALAEWFSDENSRDDGPETSWAAVQKEYADGGNWLRESMGKALIAALTPQPKDAT